MTPRFEMPTGTQSDHHQAQKQLQTLKKLQMAQPRPEIIVQDLTTPEPQMLDPTKMMVSRADNMRDKFATGNTSRTAFKDLVDQETRTKNVQGRRKESVPAESVEELFTIGTKSNNGNEVIAEDTQNLKPAVEFHSMTSHSFLEKLNEKSQGQEALRLGTYGNTEGSDHAVRDNYKNNYLDARLSDAFEKQIEATKPSKPRNRLMQQSTASLDNLSELNDC